MADAHIPLFTGCLNNMTVDQRSLLYWAKFYYEYVSSKPETECPDDFTIDYDILFDDWLERKHFKEGIKTPRASASNMDTVISFD